MRNKPAPSLNDRLVAAQGLHTSALAGFESAATTLDATSDQLDALATEARAEIERLEAIEASAAADRDRASRASANVRALFA